MTALEPCGRFDPALGRLPGAVAHALFHGDDWLATSSLSITTALEAAAPNTRIAWACDWAVFRTWALGRAAVPQGKLECPETGLGQERPVDLRNPMADVAPTADPFANPQAGPSGAHESR
ncbi:hypothetical protein [uncultured Thiodictyon sp.]|uniref:hypothetical protein n=1 Tax=uncultured Thiodictyon sp. TaxID=1846217 RepID=UPI0025F4DFEB|nr:hypothetical protein [uncultured Thiodictyon sp.]